MGMGLGIGMGPSAKLGMIAPLFLLPLLLLYCLLYNTY